MAIDTVVLDQGNGFMAFAGLRVRRILSTELFAETAGVGAGAHQADVARLCFQRWADLANAVAALPEPLEFLVLHAVDPAIHPGSIETYVTFLAVGRGSDVPEATRRAREAHRALWTLTLTTLDYCEVEELPEELAATLVGHLAGPQVLEVRRRVDSVQVVHGALRRAVTGFVLPGEPPGHREPSPGRGPAGADHLFPWVPSNDPWRRLLEALHESGQAVALVVHLRGWDRAPHTARDVAARRLVDIEDLLKAHQMPGPGQPFLFKHADSLRAEASSRLALLEGPVLSARTFLVGEQPMLPALVATVVSSVDDASVDPGQYGAQAQLRGGADLRKVASTEILAAFGADGPDDLFGPQEAPAVLRTPMPSGLDLPGLPLNRARTALLTGRSGKDVPIGLNVHRGARIPVAIDDAMRFRHAYVVGQTGTGKSTFLLNMILEDLRRGRGVCLLDPHGSLIEDILLRFPQNRAHDLVLVDPTDTERPVGLNLLRICEPDPSRYRLLRDLLIDDLYGYLDRIYDMKLTGGPMFETHFRGMLALLLGIEQPDESMIPNLMLFRPLYNNASFRESLVRRCQGRDIVIQEFVKEAIRAGGEASIQNLAPYVSAKFSRFISDTTLRNMTCQNRLVDFDAVVREGKILLVNLGKGRFGDQAAGLLASQIVSRLRYAVMHRGPDPDARPFYLYADEFQMFADDRFAELLAEARKFGLSLTLAHQFVDQLPDKVLRAVMGNVGTLAAFRVGARDAEVLEPLFWPVFSRRDLSSQPNFRAFVRSFGLLGQTPFSVVSLGPPDGADPAAAAQLRELSRQVHGRPRDVVEAEIERTWRAHMGE